VVSHKTVARLSRYRRLFTSLREQDAANIYSHQLARHAVVSAAQVRRDFMAIGYSGSPNRGYEVELCPDSIGSSLDGPAREEAARVGAATWGAPPCSISPRQARPPASSPPSTPTPR